MRTESTESMEREIRTIVAAKAARDPAQLGADEDFEEDLGLDSLDRLDLLAEVEDELGIRISEDRISDVRTLDGLLRAAAARPRERAA
jgi:acyl carrier protein